MYTVIHFEHSKLCEKFTFHQKVIFFWQVGTHVNTQVYKIKFFSSWEAYIYQHTYINKQASWKHVGSFLKHRHI